MAININRAIKEAIKSDHHQFRHATLLFKGSRLIATGYNYGKKHAEIMALNKVKHKGGAAGAIAFNIRLTKLGTLAMSRPCIDCANALDAAGVSKTIYTKNNNEIGIRFKGMFL